MHQPVRNIALVVEYDGTDFHGFQVQPALRTVQGELEQGLLSVAQEQIRVAAAGRTDAGVHALGQVVSFKTKSQLSPDAILRALNSVLPDDLVVKKCVEAPPDFHARFSARSRWYRYTILNRPEPTALARAYVYHFKRRLDLEAMQMASDLLVGTHDYASFARVGSGATDTIRTVCQASWSRLDSLVFFDIGADGFLPQMVRGIVGTLIWVGTNKISVDEFREVMEARDRKVAGPTVPARGLCFIRATYGVPFGFQASAS